MVECLYGEVAGGILDILIDVDFEDFFHNLCNTGRFLKQNTFDRHILIGLALI